MPLRHSRPSATPTSGTAEAQLPSYQTPAAPLNATGQQALRRLRNQNEQEKLNQHIARLNTELQQSVYNVNMSLATQEEWMKKRKEKFGDEDQKYKSRISTVEALVDRVEATNAALEKKLREVIDAQHKRQKRQDALRSIIENMARDNGRSVVAATQSTLGASQFRSRADGDIDEDDDEDPAEPVTPDAGPGINVLLKRRAEEDETNYAQLPLGDRYAQHHDYAEFRQMLHDGKYAANEAERPVMPLAQTWFSADGPVFVNTSQDTDSARDDGLEGSDVEAVAENVNMKCPITLVVMKDPVKSRKCPHHFERSAIESMLEQSITRTNGRYGQRTVQCPVCVVMLTADDLVADASLKRRIERNVASQAQFNGDSDDEDRAFQGSGRGMARAQTIDSQFEPSLSNMIQVKEERSAVVKTRTSLVPARE